MSDELLLEKIAGGDRDAFAELYRRHRSDIFRFAAHMCGSQTAAEDITHEVFVAVIEGAARYRQGEQRVKLWMFGIARNHARRARAAGPTLSLGDHDATRRTPEPAHETDPVADIERQRHVDALRRAVVELPVRYREAVVLCDLHELSYADAAAALSCAIGTVRSRLHRGRALLARRLCGGRAEHPCTLPATRTMS